MKYLIFDFDGTITESLPVMFEIVNQLSEKYGFKKLDPWEISLFRDQGSREVIKNLRIPIYRLPKIVSDIRKGLEDNIEHLTPVKGIEEVLRSLNTKGVGLSILTSNSDTSVRTFIKKYNWNYFDFIFSGSSLFGKGKVLKKLIKERGLTKDYIVYVGDETRDIEAAREAGVRVAAVTWGYNSRKPLEKSNPDWLMDKPQDLLTL